MIDQTSDLIGEIFALKDDPREPLVFGLDFQFKSGAHPSPLGLRLASQKLFERHARLRSRLILSKEALRWVSEDNSTASLDAITETCWSENHLSFESFQSVAIDWTKAPLFRFRYDESLGVFSARFHHSLVDGKASLDLMHELLAINLGAEITHPVQLQTKTSKQNWIVSIARVVRETLQTKRNPTLLFGDASNRFGTQIYTLYSSINQAVFQRALENLRNDIADVKAHDVFLAAQFRSFARLTDSNHQIVVNTPVNLRAYSKPHERFSNWSSMMPTSLPPALAREVPRETLKHVHFKTSRSKFSQHEWHLIDLLRIAKSLGLMRRAYAQRAKSGLALRALLEGKSEIEGSSTATLSNLGQLDFDSRILETLHAVYFSATHSPANQPDDGSDFNSRPDSLYSQGEQRKRWPCYSEAVLEILF